MCIAQFHFCFISSFFLLFLLKNAFQTGRSCLCFTQSKRLIAAVGCSSSGPDYLHSGNRASRKRIRHFAVRGKKRGYDDVDIIYFVPEDAAAKTAKLNPMVRYRQVPDEAPVAEAPPTAEEVTPPAAEGVTTAAEIACRAAVAAASYDAAHDEGQAAAVTTIPSGLVGKVRIPKNFGQMNAQQALGIKLPAHIEARLQLLDPEMRVETLFGPERTACKALMGWQINSLKKYCGTGAYSEVSVRSNNKDCGKMGLLELIRHLHLKGGTMRAKTKGMMFFFLACRAPSDIVFPESKVPKTPNKPVPVFTLSEKGRLVSFIHYIHELHPFIASIYLLYGPN